MAVRSVISTAPKGAIKGKRFKQLCKENNIHYVYRTWWKGVNVYYPIFDDAIPNFRKWFCIERRILDKENVSDEEFLRELGIGNISVLSKENVDEYDAIMKHSKDQHVFWWDRCWAR